MLATAPYWVPNAPVLGGFEPDLWSPSAQRRLFQQALDFSHCAAYQSASIKCFIRAMGLFAGPTAQPTRKKSLPQPTTAPSAPPPGGVAQAPRRASGLMKLATKRHTHRVHFRALQPSTIRAGHDAPRSAHFERMGKERIYPFLCQMAKVELHALR